MPFSNGCSKSYHASFLESPDTTDLATKMRKPALAKSKAKRVAIYASVANSYLWEGDWSSNRQTYQDDLVATYTELKTMSGIQLDILTDEQLCVHPEIAKQFDLIVLPHVTAMPPEARSALIHYSTLGGKLLADMRPDEYRPDGSFQTDTALRVMFGIGAIQAFLAPIDVRGSDGNVVTLEKQQQYIDGFLIAPYSGFNVTFKRVGGNGEGLVVRGQRATIFGFLPLLVEGGTKDWARKQFKKEVLRLVQ